MAATAALAAGACLGALPGAGAPASAAASDQAVAYQVDAVHSGAQPGDALTAPLLQGWSVDLGGPVSYPLVAGGRVFVTVGSTVSGQHSRLVALDEASGATLWTTPDLGGTYTFSASAYDGGRVFTVNDSGLLDGFDAATGAMTWSVKLPVQYMFTSPPTALNGTVYVGGAGTGGTVYAVSETNGALLWSQPVMNGDDSSPAATASGVYVTYACQQDYAFNPADGTPLWHHATGCEGGGGATPVVAGGRVYDLNSGLVNGTRTSPVILDASTGAEVGGFTADHTPAFDGSTAFLMSQGTLRSVAMPGGTVNWSFAGDGTLASAPVVANGTVYVGGSSGMLYGLDEASGAVVWSQQLNGSLAATTGCVCQVTGLAVAESHLVAPAGSTLSAFVTAPAVTGVSPQTGSTLGGAAVTVSGRGFTGATAVTFGTRPATSFSVTSDGSITATSPPEAAGLVDVRVTVPAGTSVVSAADRFLYVAPPTVTRVCPNQGPTRGGTQVTITGTGLGGATAVSFGGVAAGYTVISATQISAVTPPHVAATVDVTVTTAFGTSAASSADRFVYAKKPRPTC